MRVPSNCDKSAAQKMGWRWRIALVGIGAYVAWRCFALEQKEWYVVPVGVASAVLGLVLGYFGYGWGYVISRDKSRCPKCRKPFCIEYTDEKTLSETFKYQPFNMRYRMRFKVGVKGISWRCKRCGFESYGKKKYKEYDGLERRTGL